VARMRWGEHIGWSAGARDSILLLDLSQHLDCRRVAQWVELCCDVDSEDAGDSCFFCSEKMIAVVFLHSAESEPPVFTTTGE
jgi:hypothetical protein